MTVEKENVKTEEVLERNVDYKPIGEIVVIVDKERPEDCNASLAFLLSEGLSNDLENHEDLKEQITEVVNTFQAILYELQGRTNDNE